MSRMKPSTWTFGDGNCSMPTFTCRPRSVRSLAIILRPRLDMDTLPCSLLPADGVESLMAWRRATERPMTSCSCAKPMSRYGCAEMRVRPNMASRDRRRMREVSGSRNDWVRTAYSTLSCWSSAKLPSPSALRKTMARSTWSAELTANSSKAASFSKYITRSLSHMSAPIAAAVRIIGLAIIPCIMSSAPLLVRVRPSTPSTRARSMRVRASPRLGETRILRFMISLARKLVGSELAEAVEDEPPPSPSQGPRPRQSRYSLRSSLARDGDTSVFRRSWACAW
mmetsp:Transcript_91106/g.235273  ORF Transcript_91106/g.235273 Transcript_91106/m.235273 type:complete len:282 (-) Transcript_91106:1133-1978(-)